MVSLFVALDEIASRFFIVEPRLGKNSRPGRVDARSEDLAGLHEISVSEHVRCRALRVTRSRHTVSQVRQILPHLSLVDSTRRPHVRVNVHEARDDRFAGYINDL